MLRGRLRPIVTGREHAVFLAACLLRRGITERSTVMDFFLDGNNRRSHERFQSNAMVQYFFKKSSMRYMDCDLVNVSRSGMAIRVPASEAVASGMEVLLEITLPGSLDQITVRGTVVWFLSGETTLTGIRFESLIEPELLTRLIVC